MSNVRIIAGQYGSRIIKTPDGTRTHPMGERIKGALFNMLGDISDLAVLDTFAGSGALGLEALSRGASHATFVEKDRSAYLTITHNIGLLDVRERSKAIRTTVASWDETTDEQFDLIFADPPYWNVQLSTVIRLFSHLKPNGLMVLSIPGSELAPTVNGVVVVDKRSYGDAALAIYRKEQS